MKILIYLSFALCLAAGTVQAGNSESNFGGVGIDGVALADGQIRVTQLVQGGPAQQAGIRTGDIITHIDGKPTQGADFRNLVLKRLRGLSGTPVMLRIRREGEPKPLTLTLIRRQLVIKPNKERVP